MAVPSPLALIQSVPPVTRAFTATTIVSSAFYGYLCWQGSAEHAARYMTIVPGYAIYAPWTLLTSAFVEVNIFEFIATILFVPAALKYLERLWGGIETAKFIVVSIVASNIIAFGFNWIEYFVTRSDIFLIGMQYRGQMALQIALMVAFTQLIPEHQVQLFGVIRARVKNLPMAYLTLSTVLCIVGFQCPWIIIQFGWFVGWVYLRFYKKSSDGLGGGDTYGDRSETFSLISWFPPFMHYPLTILGNFVYGLATRFHLIPGVSAHDLENGGYAPLPQNNGGRSTREEAERRRAMALQALDQRLANPKNPQPQPLSHPRPGSSSGAANTSSPPQINGRTLERSASASESNEPTKT